MGIARQNRKDDWRHYGRLRGYKVERAWGDFFGRLPWSHSITLTFHPKRFRSLTLELANEETARYLSELARLCRQPVVWVYVVEPGTDAGWHVHVLLLGAGSPNWDTLKGMWRMRCGVIDVRRVYEAKGIALYTTKQARDCEVFFSDTLTFERFKNALTQERFVPLFRESR